MYLFRTLAVVRPFPFKTRENGRRIYGDVQEECRHTIASDATGVTHSKSPSNVKTTIPRGPDVHYIRELVFILVT